MHKLDWSDLQFILAVANHGSLAGAARELKVNHSTVLRRINTFEFTHAVRLFERQRSGYTLTPEGENMLQAARSVETVVNDLERKIEGKEQRPAGIIRLTTTDSLLYYLLNPHLAAFHQAFPEIVVKVTVTQSLLSLTRRDADVAIRAGREKPETLDGTKLSDLNFALYAAKQYWAGREHLDLQDQAWLSLDDAMVNTPPGRWLHANVPNERIIFTADTFVALQHAAEAGLGITILPCFLGDGAEQLTRIGQPLHECRNGLWILAHKDMFQSVRIKTFTDFMIKAVKQHEAPLLG